MLKATFVVFFAASVVLASGSDDKKTLETVAMGTNAVLTLEFHNETININDIRKVECSVTLNSRTRLLGNWTTGTATPILRLAPALTDIFAHRLTVSYRNGVVSISLTNTTFADSALYSCMSPKGHKSQIDLQIGGGPILVSKNFTDSITLSESSTETFELAFCGNPKPSVHWALQKKNSTSVNGVPLNKTFGFKSEYITEKYNLKTHCYKYVFKTPPIYRDPCNLTTTYTAEGDHSIPITGRVTFSVSFQPEPVTQVRTMKTEDCLHTQWAGPVLNPDACRLLIEYDVEVVRKSSKSSIVFKSYSNNYLLCSRHVGGHIKDVIDVRVRYTNTFGKGEYVSTVFTSSLSPKITTTAVPQTTVFVEDTGEKDGGFKNIAIVTSGLLGLFIFAIIIFIVYYAVMNGHCTGMRKRRSVELGKDLVDGRKKQVLKKTVSTSEATTKNLGSASTKTLRKNRRIQKENIVHKPRTLSQVTSNQLVKSHTFSGYDAVNNRFAAAGGEETLQKGYMPLNTLQRRISESLLTINSLPPPKKISALPSFDEIFENANVEMDDDERKRASGASAETECTSLSSRNTVDVRGSHLSLGRTCSLDSAISDYDMPYTIDVERIRRKSIYDFPRTPLSERHESANGDSPAYEQMNKSEYARPSDVMKPRDLSDEEELRRKRMSVYDSPRTSAMIPEEQESPDGNTTPNASRYTDDKVIYDKPRVAPANSNGFEAPVISQITGLYDTPRIRPEEDDQSCVDTANNSILTGSNENLYDNINFILTKYGCSSADSTEQTNAGRKHTDC